MRMGDAVAGAIVPEKKISGGWAEMNAMRGMLPANFIKEPETIPMALNDAAVKTSITREIKMPDGFIDTPNNAAPKNKYIKTRSAANAKSHTAEPISMVDNLVGVIKSEPSVPVTCSLRIAPENALNPVNKKSLKAMPINTNGKYWPP